MGPFWSDFCQHIKLVLFQFQSSLFKSKQYENRQLGVHAVIPVRQRSSLPLSSSADRGNAGGVGRGCLLVGGGLINFDVAYFSSNLRPVKKRFIAMIIVCSKTRTCCRPKDKFSNFFAILFAVGIFLQSTNY